MRRKLDDLALSRTFALVDASDTGLAHGGGPASANGNLARRSVHFERLDLIDELQDLHLAAPVASMLGGNGIIDCKYRLLSLLAEGGMGCVYHVRHLLLNKEMALKTFRTGKLSPMAWQRFQREAQAIGKLTHGNIIQVFDFGICEGNIPYYTMELLSGRSLAERLKVNGRLTLEEALPIFTSVSAALMHAHNLGIVHRDIKPGNIFLNQSGGGKEVVKVVDFGLAKLATSQSYESQQMTDTGLIFGSPLYMSPEQSGGQPTDHRSDIYSFGCAFFEVLTGQPPFYGISAFETIRMHMQAKPPRLVDAAPELVFCQMLEDIVAKLLAKDVEKRYQSFEDVQRDLRRLANILGLADPTNGRPSRIKLPALATEPEPESKTVPKTIPKMAAIIAASERSAVPFNSPIDKSQHLTTQLPSRPLPFTLWSSSVLSIATLSVAVLICAFASQIHAHPLAKPTVLFATTPGGVSMQKTLSAISASSIAVSAGSVSFAPVSFAPVSIAPVSAAPVYAKPFYNRPFYSSISPSGQKKFFFPPDERVGYLSWDGCKRQLAEGVMLVPQGKPVTLEVSEELSLNPEGFACFRPDDIQTLVYGGFSNCNETLLRSVCQYLPLVNGLSLNTSSVKDSDIQQLNQLEHLTQLHIADTDITGNGLAKFKGLRRLESLDAGAIDDVSVALEALAGSTALKSLALGDCHLTDADINTISSMPALEDLDLSGCQISNANLKTLRSLHNLRVLKIPATGLTTASIQTIHQFKGLKLLRMDIYDWPPEEILRLRNGMPKHCYVFDRNDSSCGAIIGNVW